jgi:hypothetical protein
MSSVKFFSERWCEEALRAETAHDRLLKAFKDPKTFTHVLAFELTDRPRLVSLLKYVERRPVAWTSTELSAEDEGRLT